MKISLTFVALLLLTLLASCSSSVKLLHKVNKKDFSSHEYENKCSNHSNCDLEIMLPRRPPCPVGHCRFMLLHRNENVKIKSIIGLDTNGEIILKSSKFLGIGPLKFKMSNLDDIKFNAIEKFEIQHKMKGENGMINTTIDR